MDVSDAVFTLRWLFTSGPAPPYPLDYGSDPTADHLNCEVSYEEPCLAPELQADS
jgi:hypothetical protein